MKLIKFLISIIIVQHLSSCCESELTNSYSLTDSQKSLIPITKYNELQYLDNHGFYYIATTQPREIVGYTRSPGAESCKYSTHERMWTYLNFLSKGFVVRIELDASYDTNFELYKLNEGAPFGDLFDLSCTWDSIPLEERMKDTTIMGINFKNVFVFKDCSNGSSINQILYSPENGIEFIEYKNGDFLKFIKKLNSKIQTPIRNYNVETWKKE